MPDAVSRGCTLPVALAWLGIALGLVCFASSAEAAPDVERRIFAAGMPTPEDITAYATAITGAIITAVNTALLIWHKLSEHKRPRRRRRPKADEKTES